jgi:hypothetical protein
MRLTHDEAWDAVVGMSWPWDYCKTGTATKNAPAIRDWIVEHIQDAMDCRREFGDTSYRRIVTCSIKVARAVAAEMHRQQKSDEIGHIGFGFGEIRFP